LAILSLQPSRKSYDRMPLHALLLQGSTMLSWLRQGQYRVVLDALRRRCYSDAVSIELQRDLTAPCAPSTGDIPVTVRPLRERALPQLLNPTTPGLTEAGVKARVARLGLLQAGIPQCYAAETAEGCRCHLQWLIGPAENARVQAYFDFNPVLGPAEALVEYVFTLESYRGHHILAAATAQVARIAREGGTHRLIAFVAQDNTASRRAFAHASFAPCALRHERRWRFRGRATYTPLPAGTRCADLAG
jgi:hypothetical protein